MLLAIPFVRCADLPTGQLTGRIVIDAGNYYPNRDGHYAALDADETTSSELLAEQIGLAAVDAGTLAAGGRKMQPGAPLSGELLTEAEARARV